MFPNEQEIEATRTTSRAFAHEFVQKLRRIRLRILIGRSKLLILLVTLRIASSIGDAATFIQIERYLRYCYRDQSLERKRERSNALHFSGTFFAEPSDFVRQRNDKGSHCLNR